MELDEVLYVFIVFLSFTKEKILLVICVQLTSLSSFGC